MVKISVISICKNESKFISSWLNSLWNNGNGADKVYLLDTGSTDNTEEILNEEIERLNIPKDWLVFGKKEYSIFRFDTARNDCMKLINDDSDLYLSLDLDEVVTPDFWIDAKKAIEKNPKFSKLRYNYCWEQDEQNNPLVIFCYDRAFSSKNSVWHGVTHEYIIPYNNDYPEIFLDSDKIYVYHYPDKTKDRSFDLNLILMRCLLYGDDQRSWYYLCRETKKKCELLDLTKISAKNGIELAIKYNDKEILPILYVYLANCYEIDNDVENVRYFYNKAIESSNYMYCSPYIEFGYYEAYGRNPQHALEIVRAVRNNKDKFKKAFFEDSSYLTWRPYHIEAISLAWLGKYEESLNKFEIAINKYLKDDKIERNIAEESYFFKDYEFVFNKLKKEDLNGIE